MHTIKTQNRFIQLGTETTCWEIEDKIAHLDTDTILAACKDIYDWRKDGCLKKDSMLNVLYTSYELHSDIALRVLEDMIIRNAHVRFKWIVPLLLSDNPGKYLK